MEEVLDRYGKIYQLFIKEKISGYWIKFLLRCIYKYPDFLNLFENPADHVGIRARVFAMMHTLEWAGLRCDDLRRISHRKALRAPEEQWLFAPVPRS